MAVTTACAPFSDPPDRPREPKLVLSREGEGDVLADGRPLRVVIEAWSLDRDIGDVAVTVDQGVVHRDASDAGGLEATLSVSGSRVEVLYSCPLYETAAARVRVSAPGLRAEEMEIQCRAPPGPAEVKLLGCHEMEPGADGCFVIVRVSYASTPPRRVGGVPVFLSVTAEALEYTTATTT